MAAKKTHWKKEFEYEYLGAYSLADSDDEENATYTPVNVTLIKTGRKKVKNERGTEDCFVCWFKEKVGGEAKPMILNKTNCAILEKVHGSGMKEDWINKPIQLWVDLKVKAQGGEITKGLRFQNSNIPLPKPKAKPELTPKSPRWAGAKKSFDEGTIDVAGLEKHFTISKVNLAILKKAK